LDRWTTNIEATKKARRKKLSRPQRKNREALEPSKKQRFQAAPQSEGRSCQVYGEKGLTGRLPQKSLTNVSNTSGLQKLTETAEKKISKNQSYEAKGLRGTFSGAQDDSNILKPWGKKGQRSRLGTELLGGGKVDSKWA